jgi:hypothetical protein
MTDRRRARDEGTRRAPKSSGSRSAEPPGAAGQSGSPPLSTPISSGSSAPSEPSAPSTGDPERDRRVRRARFLADLAEARELRKRVAPRRAKAAELEARVLRTFRY